MERHIEEQFVRAYFDTAMHTLYSCGLPYAVFDVKKRTAYLETEYDFSVHTSYLLKADIRAE